MAAEPSLTLTIYIAEPGPPAEEGLRLLASWTAAAAADPAERSARHERSTRNAEAQAVTQ